MVMSYAAECNVPIVITLGGGYSNPIALTAEAHANTFRTAADVFARGAENESALVDRKCC
jgi:acetoin utilization deacetylase AcuC-like enzyme